MTSVVGEVVVVDDLLVVAVSLRLPFKDERHDVPISRQEPSPREPSISTSTPQGQMCIKH